MYTDNKYIFYFYRDNLRYLLNLIVIVKLII